MTVKLLFFAPNFKIVLLIHLLGWRMPQTRRHRDCKRGARLCCDRAIARVAALGYRFGICDLPPSSTGRHVDQGCSCAQASRSRADKSRHRLHGGASLLACRWQRQHDLACDQLAE